MSEDVVRADRTYRDSVYLLYVVIILGSILFSRYGFPRVRGYYESLGVMDLIRALRNTFIVLLICFTPAAVYIIHVGRRILEHGQYPYPGRKVMFDTRVISGDGARRRGKALVALGSVFMVMMVVCVVYVYVRFNGWLSNPDFRRFYGPPSAYVGTLQPVSVHDS